jgi:hypothetical protein
VGIDINLQNENGEILESVGDPRNLLSKLLPNGGFSLLSGIDRYGDTTFNRLQMDPFLQEWGHLHSKAPTSEQAKLLGEIEKLALRCRDGRHLHLKFVGD